MFVSSKNGAYLHRFKWLDDKLIGEFDLDWNWLAIEYEENPKANLIHYTLGTPCFKEFANTAMSKYWHDNFKKMLNGYFNKKDL